METLYDFLTIAHYAILLGVLLLLGLFGLLVHDDLDVSYLHWGAVTCITRTGLAILAMLAISNLIVLREVALCLTALDAAFLVNPIGTLRQAAQPLVVLLPIQTTVILPTFPLLEQICLELLFVALMTSKAELEPR